MRQAAAAAVASQKALVRRPRRRLHAGTKVRGCRWELLGC